jgi:hypothetical protein
VRLLIRQRHRLPHHQTVSSLSHPEPPPAAALATCSTERLRRACVSGSQLLARDQVQLI